MFPQFFTLTSWLVAIVFGLIFTLSYRHEKRRLVNGVFFNLFLFSTLAAIAFSILQSGNRLLTFGLFAIIIILFIALLAFYLLQSILLLWNAWIVWHKESHSLANMLTFALGIAVILIPIISNLFANHLPKPFFIFINSFSYLVIFYVLFWFYNYLTMLVLYQFNRPKFNQDFIIVLGSGLLHGDQVPPLLQARINRGLDFQQKQLQKTGKCATMVFSGGQGPDETVPEGQAMLKYAISQGLDATAGVAETKSKTTLENMQFSKQLIDQSTVVNPNVIFVTNNYHTFRASLFAKQVGLHADGIGARTAKFFLPNAVIREYIAIFVRQKKWHLVAISLLLIVSVVSTILETYFVGQ